MAFSLQITACRQTDLTVLPPSASAGSPGGYTLAIGYVLCTSGAGGKPPLHEVLYDRQQQWVRTAMAQGHPMPTIAEIGALIRADCQALFGGQPDNVLISGTEV